LGDSIEWSESEKVKQIVVKPATAEFTASMSKGGQLNIDLLPDGKVAVSAPMQQMPNGLYLQLPKCEEIKITVKVEVAK